MPMNWVFRGSTSVGCILEKVRRGLYTSPEFSGNAHLTHVMKRLGGLWFLAASLLSLVPRALRDLGYVTCAFLRKAILGTTQEVCPLVPTQWCGRFRD
jgi:predicted DCC family thiol-disulfide oxidoreductase YuxK